MCFDHVHELTPPPRLERAKQNLPSSSDLLNLLFIIFGLEKTFTLIELDLGPLYGLMWSRYLQN